ncbi:MAG: GTP cyclohydrolase FolE2 [Roseateles sp.]
MNARLPDEAMRPLPQAQATLDGVGMQGVALRVRLQETGLTEWQNALAGVTVDLPDPQRKGIHMSRLYLRLDAFAQQQPLTPVTVAALMAELVDSHRDCGSTRAALALDFQLMLRRPALATPGLAGWKPYPVTLTAECQDGNFTLRMAVGVTYSSTCPCSAALSRQLLEQAFMAEFGDQAAVAPESVAAWLLEHGSLATPHSQRSLAIIHVDVGAEKPSLGMLALIDAAEMALGTPVQTAVKRPDEQAFARLNGAHLMYVEDAARCLDAALRPAFALRSVEVRHMESLHAHDAMARIGAIG